MTRPPRFVILADHVTTSAVRLSVAPNGYVASPSDIAAIATSAALLPRITPRGVWITPRELADFQAMCQHRGVVVQVAKRGRRP